MQAIITENLNLIEKTTLENPEEVYLLDILLYATDAVKFVSDVNSACS
ncbi:MAG: hypothetical protein ABUK01_09865 [Leptospirales bacterium]